ncbi:MAG: hypothetical protein KDC67_14025 [Ignavibacteriae bacterium]|nr:hypothetical protein [Ignavibacteriota bacterium]
MTSITYQFELIQAIRNFFLKNDFIDVLTPPLVENPGMETHIHSFRAFKNYKKELSDLYLHTSPEFHMKKLLAENSDLQNIFTISYCFRDEPRSPIHREQFLMLEWYRRDAYYEKIMDDVEDLIRYCQSFFSKNILARPAIHQFERTTVAELFQNILHIDIHNFTDKTELKKLIEKDFKDVPLPMSECNWDDYFFLLFLNKIEPQFVHYPYLLVKEFPSQLAALSTLKKSDPRVCERFEVYLSGVELCNCFNELTDMNEQIKRFTIQQQEKLQLYNYELPWPKEFIMTLQNGHPKSSGIALGIERLLCSLLKVENPFFS